MSDPERRLLKILGRLGLWISPDAPPAELPPELREPPALDPALFEAKSGLRGALDSAIDRGVVPSAEEASRLRRLLARRASPRALPRWVAAAALVLACAGLGTAAGVAMVRVPALIASSGTARMAELLNPRPDFRAAEISPHAEPLDAVSFVWSDGAGSGRLQALTLPGDRGLDLCAFDAQGRPAWRASSDLAWWSDLLERPRLQLHELKCVVLRRTADELDEAVCAVVYAGGQSLVLVLDPQTGEKRGHFFIDGNLTTSGRTMESIAPLPTPRGSERNLAVLGSAGRGPFAQPVALVFRADGTVLQQLRLPSIGYQKEGTDFAERMTSLWGGDRPEVRIETEEGIQFHFLVENGLLAVPSGVALLNDDAADRYNEAHRAEDAWERFVETKGGLRRYRVELAAGVRDAGQEGVDAQWHGR